MVLLSEIHGQRTAGSCTDTSPEAESKPKTGFETPDFAGIGRMVTQENRFDKEVKMVREATL